MANKQRTQPLYVQLAERLERLIRHEMKAHDRLLSERELTEAYGVSRMTVRLALQELEKKGLIYKETGKGTFVSTIAKPSTDLSKTYSFTEQMKHLGKKPETRLLSFQLKEVTSYLSSRLGLSEGQLVFELERLRLADGVPLLLERSYLPQILFPDLTEGLLRGKPLYTLFEEVFSQVIKRADEEVFASIALEYEASQLQITKGSPVLHLLRRTYNDKNHLLEYTYSIARGDQFRYHFTHVK